MLGSLLHFESKPAKKKRKKKKRKKEPVLSSPRTNDHRSPSFLTQSWQAESSSPSSNANTHSHRRAASTSFSNLRDRSRSFDTFDADGKNRSLSTQSLTAALTSLTRSYGAAGGLPSNTTSTQKTQHRRRARTVRRTRANSARNLFQTEEPYQLHPHSNTNTLRQQQLAPPRNHSDGHSGGSGIVIAIAVSASSSSSHRRQGNEREH